MKKIMLKSNDIYITVLLTLVVLMIIGAALMWTGIAIDIGAVIFLITAGVLFWMTTKDESTDEYEITIEIKTK